MKKLKVHPLNPAKILLTRKLSILEYDMQKFHLTETEAINRYKKMGVDTEKVLASHQRQIDSQKIMQEYLPDSRLIIGEHLNHQTIKKYDAVVALGGDNYFQYVARFLKNTPIIGVNSDPTNSEGAILNFNTQTFKSLLPKLIQGTYRVKPWTRLKATVNGKIIKALAVSEIYIGAKERLTCSRYHIELDNIGEEHKDSGIIIATGTGSTGWYRSAASCAHNKSKSFSPTSPKAQFICTEVYHGKLNGMKLIRGTLYPGKVLKITWFAHGKGIVNIDSEPRGSLHYLDRGEGATVEISRTPLWVIS